MYHFYVRLLGKLIEEGYEAAKSEQYKILNTHT